MRGGIQRLMTKDICSQLNTRAAVIDIGSCGASDTKVTVCLLYTSFLLRREYRREIFQRYFPALKSHDFRFLFVSDSGTYKITFPFHAAAARCV